MNPSQHRLLGGAAIAAVGMACAALVHFHPERLNVPAWVAYTACAAFVLAGAALVAHERGLPRVHAWIGVALVAAMGIPGAWVAFGAGDRRCSGGFAFASTESPQWLCRGAFGLGAVIVAALFLWAVVNALRKQGKR